MGGSFVRYVLALVLILGGGALVLANLRLIDFEIGEVWIYIYPVIFVMLGLKWIVDKIRYNRGSWIFGSFFLLFGTLLLLDRFNVLDFEIDDVYKLWPLLIVYIGFSFFSGTSPKRKHRTKDKWKGKKPHKYYSGGFTVGSHEYNQPNWKVEPMNLRSLAGDFYIDFSKAFIPEEEIPIDVHSLAGDVHILIPENIPFQVDATVKAGEIDVVGQKSEGISRHLSYVTDDYETAVRKLDITVELKAGSIRVVKV
ncbi:cell wall-active antibiotics response protein LiaF [Virgibacillus kekensis]|uniref:Cell wall-active antibiotics response protein LiaF n=1 Tax=Virgibacillus kekensis TaxID=202261 RepID=A0ABV9DLF1_9BACI